MAVQLRDREHVASGLDLRRSRRTAPPAIVATIVVIAMLVGVAGAWLAYRAGVDRQRAEAVATAQQIERARSAQMVEHWESRWASEYLGAGDRVGPIRITGTGPGLVGVAEMQAAFAESAVTGTGPGLESVGEATSTARSDTAVVRVP